MSVIETIEQLEEIYGRLDDIGEASTAKVADCVTAQYRRLIEVSPFAALATTGPEGLDCSPRGDKPGFVRIHDERTLMMPDRRGNNRVDSLRNIVRDPKIALLFLIPVPAPRSASTGWRISQRIRTCWRPSPWRRRRPARLS
jgi:predicted pyridoxine 5'-phosphate oxidase superfamily flavin-nucleotide-binding protein